MNIKKTLVVFVFLGSVTAVAGTINFGFTLTATPTTPAFMDTTKVFFPVTITVIPGSASTASLYYSTTPNAYSNQGTANWEIVGNVSGVAATNTITLPSPVTAIKVTVPSGAASAVAEVTAAQS